MTLCFMTQLHITSVFAEANSNIHCAKPAMGGWLLFFSSINTLHRVGDSTCRFLYVKAEEMVVSECFKETVAWLSGLEVSQVFQVYTDPEAA